MSTGPAVLAHPGFIGAGPNGSVLVVDTTTFTPPSGAMYPTGLASGVPLTMEATPGSFWLAPDNRLWGRAGDDVYYHDF